MSDASRQPPIPQLLRRRRKPAQLDPLVLGIDVGTSGVRVVALDAGAKEQAISGCRFASLSGSARDPAVWWQALEHCLGELFRSVAAERIVAIGVDGTSGTVLPIDMQGRPLAAPLMYNDAVPDQRRVDCVARHMPEQSAAGGATSGLAKALHFQALQPARIVHQADWILGCLGNRHGHSDANNALKSGYDPVAGVWPNWLSGTGMRMELLPTVHLPGTCLHRVDPGVAARFGLQATTCLMTGTTDGCASFLATGAARTGDAVTALGSTLTLKILSDKPLFVPELGLYSHRIGDLWLAGGASNTGGQVLAHYFSETALKELSRAIDTRKHTGLDYYPLLTPGERFPRNNPNLPPRLTPRPDDDVLFLQAMLEGIAAIEAEGYQALLDAGVAHVRSIRTVGGGAGNASWHQIREQRLPAPLVVAASDQAATGTARLVLKSANASGLIPCMGA